MMAATEQTHGQVERHLSQQIQALYREQLGQRPSKVMCQFFDEKLAVVLEDTVSPVERTLLAAGYEELAQQLRLALDTAIKPVLKPLIEGIIETSIAALLIDSDLKSGFSSITVILVDVPPVRNPESIPKVKKDKFVYPVDQQLIEANS